MKTRKWTANFAALSIVIFLINPDVIFTGAISGIDICLKTVIPSLFPFFVLSSILTQAIQGKSIPWLKPIGRLCGVPQGAEFIILLGTCGGYPVGAKAVSEAYCHKIISKADANRMLCFCNNAGPAFIFGMASSIFQSKLVPWMLWSTQIISMLVTAAMLPGKSVLECHPNGTVKTNIMEQTLKAMASVCGWVVFMRIILCLLNQWLFFSMPEILQLALTGLLELSNGCIALSTYSDATAKYILMGQLLAFGGSCVMLQTKSLIGNLDIRYYIVGKLLQAALSSALLFLTVPVVLSGSSHVTASLISILIYSVLIILIRYKNKTGNYVLHAV